MLKGSRGAKRRPSLGELVVLILVVSVGVNIATGNDDASSNPKRSADRTAEEWIREMYENDLRRKQRRLHADGTIGVTRVECSGGVRRKARIPCLAHVAATGEARMLAPIHVVISIYFHHPHYFEYDVVRGPR